MNRKVRIQVVADGPADAELLQDTLGTKPEVELSVATSVGQAVEALSRKRADVILLNMRLPEATGLEGVRDLHRRFPHIPIVAETASIASDHGVLALQEGAEDFVVKGSVDAPRLLMVLRQAIARHEKAAGQEEQAIERHLGAVLRDRNEALVSLLAEFRTQRASVLRGERQAGVTIERFNALLQSIREVFFVLSPAGDRFEFLGPNYEDVMGVSREETLKNPLAWAAAVHPDDREAALASFHGFIQSGGKSVVHEFRVLRKGECRWLVARAMAVKDAEGQTQLAGVLSDITDQVHAAELKREREAKELENHRLREVNTLRTNFLNMAAHDLNTPLTPLKLQAHLLGLSLGQGAPAGAKESLAILTRNLDRLAGLIQDILEVGRLESGRLMMSFAPTDLAKLAHESVETFAPLAAKHGIQVKVEADDACACIADERRISQVLLNLISNAVKFGNPGGNVFVRVSREVAGVVISVADDGAGLSPDDAAALFQPFIRVGASNRPGTGLGLYISRGFVRQHGGDIEAESPGRGKGATFRVWLPLSPPATPVPLPTLAPGLVPGGAAPGG